jgi:Virulence factor BrkB
LALGLDKLGFIEAQ